MNSRQHRALCGIEGLRVVIEEIDLPEADAIEARLQRKTERKLTRGGLPLLAIGPWLRTPGSPYLYVNITATRLPRRGLRSFCIALELHQQASMARDPQVVISTCTWEQELIDMVPEGQLAAELDAALGTLVDGFIDDYRAAQA